MPRGSEPLVMELTFVTGISARQEKKRSLSIPGYLVLDGNAGTPTKNCAPVKALRQALQIRDDGLGVFFVEVVIRHGRIRFVTARILSRHEERRDPFGLPSFEQAARCGEIGGRLVPTRGLVHRGKIQG